MIMDYHYMRELRPVGCISIARLGRAPLDACVDLNPYQIDTALFALRSPLSKGALIAGEGIHPCCSMVQINTFHAEFDTKTKKGVRDRVLEGIPVSRNRKDRFVDFRDLVPCWLTYEWRVA